MEDLFIMSPTFFPDTIPTQTTHLLTRMKARHPAFLDSFYLSGGTALSLQLGHRESEDLDFFTPDPFDPKAVEQQLIILGSLTETELSQGTLNTYCDGVKLQFLEYPYPMLEPLVDWEGIQISSVSDIASTKLQTVGMRGSKKDFVDIFFLLKRYTLGELLAFVQKKYAASDYSETHILKSLVYFADAEGQPMPRMHQDVSWEEVIQSMITSVRSIPIA